MSYKILTKNGVENTNIDDARNHHFNSGGKSGIAKGELNEGNLFSGSSNVIALDTCELRLCGHRVIINEVEYITLSSTPAQAIRYSLIAEIKVVDSNPSFNLFYQAPSTSLIQNNLSADLLGNGTYQMEIGKFTLNTDGTISDIVRTADLINGGGNNGEGGHINIGNITTNTLDAGMEAEIDIEERYDAETNKTYTDFTFSIPKGDEGKQGLQGIQGIQGERGEQGPQGEIGEPNTLTIGTVTSGTTASATISGTAPNQVLNLVLPKGEQGEQGVQGPQGPQGDSVELYQTTGNSTTGGMSQNAITNELNSIKNGDIPLSVKKQDGTMAQIIEDENGVWKCDGKIIPHKVTIYKPDTPLDVPILGKTEIPLPEGDVLRGVKYEIVWTPKYYDTNLSENANPDPLERHSVVLMRGAGTNYWIERGEGFNALAPSTDSESSIATSFRFNMLPITLESRIDPDTYEYSDKCKLFVGVPLMVTLSNSSPYGARTNRMGGSIIEVNKIIE